MKNKKLSLNKLNLKKMTISSLQSVKGGNEDSITDPSGSQNTRMTKVDTCCSMTAMTGVCC